MEVVSYICNSTIYTVVPISNTSYIDEDINTVRDKIVGTPIDSYRSNMEESVRQGLAFCIHKDGNKVGFVYTYIKDHRYVGASIHVYGDIVSSMVALRTIFEVNDTHKIIFTPHSTGLDYFKSMATGPSIRAHHATGGPVTILRDTVYTKGQKIYKYLGIAECQQ